MNVVIFDTETGGTDETKHPLIQIAAVVIHSETGHHVDHFERKIEFEIAHCDPEALELNSYDEVEWMMDAVPEREALMDFAQWLEGYREVELVSKRTGRPYSVAQMGAYNADFDKKFLLPRYKHHDIFFPGTFHALDVMQLVLFYFHCNDLEQTPPDFKLTTVYEFFGLGDLHIDAHDAMADSKMAADVYYSLSRSLGWDR